MQSDAPVEILWAINVAKITGSPALFDLAINHKNPIGRHGVSMHPLTPFILVPLFEWDL
jgi:hypothetical protein